MDIKHIGKVVPEGLSLETTKRIGEVAKLLADRRSRWMGTVVRHTRGSA
jgi:hypothetical protein